MPKLGQAFFDLIHNNVLFKQLLPALHFPVFPIFHQTALTKVDFSVFPYLLLVILVMFALGLLFLLRLILQIRRSLRESSVLLELTPPAFTQKTAYTTSQLFSIIHNLGEKRTFLDKLLGKRILFSFEIVSTLDKGIRYLIRISPEEAGNVKRNVISYLPQVSVNVVDEYLTDWKKLSSLNFKIFEFKLSKHFAFPLQKQNVLDEHDPVAYITGMMTKLIPGELISFQIVISPKRVSEIHKLSQMILRNENVLDYLNRPSIPVVIKPITFIFSLAIKLITKCGNELQWVISELVNPNKASVSLAAKQTESMRQLQLTLLRPARVISSFEQQQVMLVQEKINQPLFETSIRVLTVMNDKKTVEERGAGFLSSLAVFNVPQYQSFTAKSDFPPGLINKIRRITFDKRLLSLIFNTSSSLLSISEIADLYHFPFTTTTQTEDLVKMHSLELPAPLSVKNNHRFDVIFGKNSFGNTVYDIGLTDEDRSRHVYIIGQTGSGKSTIMFHMAKDDIQKGRGVAVIDPHGDLSEDLLTTVPESRVNDCIYFNPFDLSYPIGVNLLELNPGLVDDELEQEKELVCESVISVFRRVFSKDENIDAHRIEYVLRNSIYTAFTVPDATIFTVYELLNNPKFQKSVTRNLVDENLENFWKNEFGRAGNYQVVKMVSGVTARIGRFLFSPTAKRILEQSKSTINFDGIFASGKILICNLAEGKLGEDTSQLLGTTIIAKLQLAAMRRVRSKLDDRTPFYLFIDEFQNFATNSFTKLLSGGRKFGLRLTIAEQSTSQQEDRNVVNVILANTGTIICFRTASPIDEQLMLSQFAPYVKGGDIVNLPRYKFYLKLSAVEPEEPFSGETLPIVMTRDEVQVENVILSSRKNYASAYIKPAKKVVLVEPKHEKTGRKFKSKEDISTL